MSGRWLRVAESPLSTPLMVYNSLSESKVPFYPIDPSQLKMYVCGPTVYDSCHLGHARTYLSFDIIRRIMEDYFHYSVKYQVNITDIDDKIITRARQAFLVNEFESSHDADQIRQTLNQALADHRSGLEETGDLLEAQLKSAEKRQLKDLQGRLEENTFKKQQHQRLEESMGEMELEAQKAACKGVLGEFLDNRERNGAQWASITGGNQIFLDYAKRFENEWLEDMRALNIRLPSVITRVTEYIEQIETYIQKLIEHEFAYESQGSVYFSSQKFKETPGVTFPKLKPNGGSVELMEAEGKLAAHASEKRHPFDFALWKKSKLGEPSWETRWGAGRPGWHIECSVMAHDVLGDQMDIHAGGSDLKFPHHDNEIAQSEAHRLCCGYEGPQQWVNYFLHTGHLHIQGLKMSKSLKNFVTIRECMETYSARQLRLLFLEQPWHKPMDFSDQSLEMAQKTEKRYTIFFNKVSSTKRELSNSPVDKEGETLLDLVSKSRHQVDLGLKDNFNTPVVMTILAELVTEANIYLGRPTLNFGVLDQVADFLDKILRIFGVTFEITESTQDIGMDVVKVLADFRQTVKTAALAMDPKNKELLMASDAVRDQHLPPLGIRLEDKPEGFTFCVEDPAVLLQEQADKKKPKKKK